MVPEHWENEPPPASARSATTAVCVESAVPNAMGARTSDAGPSGGAPQATKAPDVSNEQATTKRRIGELRAGEGTVIVATASGGDQAGAVIAPRTRDASHLKAWRPRHSPRVTSSSPRAPSR